MALYKFFSFCLLFTTNGPFFIKAMEPPTHIHEAGAAYAVVLKQGERPFLITKSGSPQQLEWSPSVNDKNEVLFFDIHSNPIVIKENPSSSTTATSTLQRLLSDNVNSYAVTRALGEIKRHINTATTCPCIRDNSYSDFCGSSQLVTLTALTKLKAAPCSRPNSGVLNTNAPPIKSSPTNPLDITLVSPQGDSANKTHLFFNQPSTPTSPFARHLFNESPAPLHKDGFSCGMQEHGIDFSHPTRLTQFSPLSLSPEAFKPFFIHNWVSS